MSFDPATIGSVISIGGSLLSGFGAYKNSQASKEAYEQQAQVNANNAQIAQWQADDALARGDRDAAASRMKTNQLKGTQRAALAANGVDLGAGSALGILADTEYFGQLDAGTIKDNAAREAWALRNQAANFTSESNLLKSRADSEKPWLAAGTSLLTSAGKVASSWYGGSSSGAVTLGSVRGSDMDVAY